MGLSLSNLVRYMNWAFRLTIQRIKKEDFITRFDEVRSTDNFLLVNRKHLKHFFLKTRNENVHFFTELRLNMSVECVHIDCETFNGEELLDGLRFVLRLASVEVFNLPLVISSLRT
jgi:hypothetical protein